MKKHSTPGFGGYQDGEEKEKKDASIKGESKLKGTVIMHIHGGGFVAMSSSSH